MTLIAIAVVERDGACLIGQRPEGVPLAGLWEFPGGKVEPGEEPAAAAVRECLEETGLAVVAVGEYPTVRHEYSHGAVELRFFACHVVDLSAQPRPPYRFVARSLLGELEFPAANRDLIAQLTGQMP